MKPNDIVKFSNPMSDAEGELMKFECECCGQALQVKDAQIYNKNQYAIASCTCGSITRFEWIHSDFGFDGQATALYQAVTVCPV